MLDIFLNDEKEHLNDPYIKLTSWIIGQIGPKLCNFLISDNNDFEKVGKCIEKLINYI